MFINDELTQLTPNSPAAPKAQSGGMLCYAYTLSNFYSACLDIMNLKKTVNKIFINLIFIYLIALSNIVFAFEDSDLNPILKDENTTLCSDILIEQCCITPMSKYNDKEQNDFRIEMPLPSLGKYIGIILGAYYMIAHTNVQKSVKNTMRALLLASFRSFSVMQANAILPDVEDSKYRYLLINFLTDDRESTTGSSVDRPEVDGRSTEVENLALTVLYPALVKLLNNNIFIIDSTSLCLVFLTGSYLGAIAGYYSGYLIGEFLILIFNGLIILFY